MENLSAELAEFERTDREEAAQSNGDHLADAFHDEAETMHEGENKGRDTT
jgi:hypothetical protein